MKKLLIIAGGTGGHIFPALTVADELQKQGVLIEWMGTEAGMEKKLIAGRYPLYFLPVKTFRGKSIGVKLIAPFRLLHAVFLAYRIIQKTNPDVVLGMGGYASGPGGIAAWLLRKPLVIHEQNAKAGLTNRLLSRFAKKVLQAFPDTFSNRIKAITVGNPVRPAIQKITHPEHHEKPYRILVLGGSQGAQTINQLMTKWVSLFDDRESFFIWHQTGQKDFQSVQDAYQAWPEVIYRVSAFIEKIEEAYAWADLVICRSGALTVAEIAAAGLPGILIPYPFAADDHQYVNALFLEKNEAGIVFRESELTAEKLNDCLKALFSSPKRLHLMSNQAKLCARSDSVSEIMTVLRGFSC
ncbi:MAG: undecaprenyldiphospho-muramoylpentapeptide beta-N-acetylglucosaminyltransferase [Gammaproteobacteria bacterium]|nr:undecaprenyldiphospho-muramoylpentapeptide beta-N-acetylglucosaminyltransferase [Gammaproteobacteria bacterium]